MKIDVKWARKFAGLNEMDLSPASAPKMGDEPKIDAEPGMDDKPEMSDEQLLQQCLSVMSGVEHVAPSVRQKFDETMKMLSNRLNQDKEVGDLNAEQPAEMDRM